MNSFLQISKIIVRPSTVLSLSQKLKYSKTSTKNVDEEFIPIYKFPYIKILHAISKLKIYQGLTTAIAVPTSGVLQSLGILEPSYLSIIAALGITGTVSLTLLASITQNFVGFMYVNQAGTIVKLSYLDFWSRRQTVEMPVNDIIPLSDMSKSYTDNLYLKLKRYSKQDTYKINLVHGKILNWECIHSVLGSVNEK